MSKSDLRVKNLSSESFEKLSDKLVFFKKELFNLRFQATLGDLKNTSKFSIVKKNIARIKTELARRINLGE